MHGYKWPINCTRTRTVGKWPDDATLIGWAKDRLGMQRHHAKAAEEGGQLVGRTTANNT